MFYVLSVRLSGALPLQLRTYRIRLLYERTALFCSAAVLTAAAAAAVSQLSCPVGYGVLVHLESRARSVPSLYSALPSVYSGSIRMAAVGTLPPMQRRKVSMQHSYHHYQVCTSTAVNVRPYLPNRVPIIH